MAVLEKIRVKLGILITVLIALALLSFIIDPNTLAVAVNSFSSKYDVGKINGSSVSYKEFQEKIDYYSNIYKLTSGEQTMNEQVNENIRESAWQDFLNELLILPTIKKAGINVGEEEMIDLSQGKEISPIIAQEASFKDETGAFSRDRLLQFIKAINNDESGNLKAYWDFLETNMSRQQYFTKYATLLSKSNFVNPVELRRGIEENNTTSNADFIVVPYGFERDSTIVITKSEMEKYYKAHQKEYKQEASRDVEFVVYEVVPSERDFAMAEESINKVYDEFTKATNLKNFLSRNSDTPLNNYYFKKGELKESYPELEAFAFETKNPTVLPVFKSNEQYLAARINSVKEMSDSTFVNHILLPATDTKKADSLLNVINKGGNFTALASEYSLDKNPNVTPGEIGWMTQRMMIPGMEEVLSLPLNKCVKMTSDYGIHIVKVTKRTAPERKVQLALLTKDVISSKETYQVYYAQANDLASKSEGKIEKFNELVNTGKLPVVPAMNVAEGSKKLSKYENAREVTRWIFEAKKGEVSSIITVDNKYFFVVAVTEVHEEGFTPLSQVATSVTFALEQTKKGEKLSSEVKGKMEGLTTMSEIAEALNTTVSSRDNIAFGSFGAQSFDPALVGAIAGAPEGKIVGPIVGNIGVYLVQVKNREVGSFYTETDAKSRAAQYANYQLNSLGSIFNEIGNIVDRRAKFF